MARQPSATPTYKVIHCKSQGLAEPTRMLLSYGGIDFEDIRLAPDEWQAFKPKTPMGQMPILEIDGIQVYQSVAIARYAANLVGLAGKNDWENLQIDIAVDNIVDFRSKIAAAHGEPNETLRQKKLEDLNKETIPFYLNKLEAAAKENNGYLTLGRLTWADVFFLGISKNIDFMLMRLYDYDFTRTYPNLKRVLANVSNIESIKAWISRRPETAL